MEAGSLCGHLMKRNADRGHVTRTQHQIRCTPPCHVLCLCLQLVQSLCAAKVQKEAEEDILWRSVWNPP